MIPDLIGETSEGKRTYFIFRYLFSTHFVFYHMPILNEEVLKRI